MECKKPETRKNHRNSLLRALLFIEKNLDQRLIVRDCAHIAHFSPFHFHRIFSSAMDETVSDYIKRRRVEKASLQLLTTGMSVTEIGMSSGYGTLAAFAKVFKQYTDMSPSRYRKEMRHANFDSIFLKGMKKNKAHSRTGSKARIEVIPDQKALFIRKKGFFSGNFNQAINDGLAELYRHVKKEKESSMILAPIVMCPQFPKALDDPAAEVFPGLLMKQEVASKGDMTFRTIEGGPYLIFQYTEPSKVYQFNWETYRDWARIKGHNLQTRFPYTELVNSAHTGSKQYKEVLHIPVW